MIIDAFTDLHWVAVAVSTIAAFAIGVIWFAPPVLGTLWARQVTQYAGIPAADVTSGAAKGTALLPWFVAIAINVVVLALAVAATGADSLADGMILGVWQRQQRRVTVHPWRKLSQKTVEAIEGEALSLPIASSAKAPAVQWEPPGSPPARPSC